MAVREFSDVARGAEPHFSLANNYPYFMPSTSLWVRGIFVHTETLAAHFWMVMFEALYGRHFHDAHWVGLGRLDAADSPMNFAATAISSRSRNRAPFASGRRAILTLSLRSPRTSAAPMFFSKAKPARTLLFVTVRVPQVIPGVAEIEVRAESTDVQSIQIVPLRLTGQGSEVRAHSGLAARSKDDPQFFTGSLWLMESGALQVRVLADGAKGQGELSVPVPSFAQSVLPMEKAP